MHHHFYVPTILPGRTNISVQQSISLCEYPYPSSVYPFILTTKNTGSISKSITSEAIMEVGRQWFVVGLNLAAK